jgi:hypothetical protein
MTVTRLIKALQKYEAQYGHLPVHMGCDYRGEDPDRLYIEARQCEPSCTCGDPTSIWIFGTPSKLKL